MRRQNGRVPDPVSPAAVTEVARRYARFARDEAPGRSAVYAEWAAGVAGRADVAAVIARIRPTRRQPPLVFAVTRMLGAPVGRFEPWAEWLVAHADATVAECEARAVQTNEPLRCAALLPALARIDGPLALLEVGASAGLCLYPDRYSYRYHCDDDTVVLDPVDGLSTVVLEARWHGATPRLHLPEVVWRAGIDLQPRDAADPADRAWLTGLVWPGEQGRAQRMAAALDIVADEPPLLVAGDAADLLDDVAARAPAGATLVVTTPGVLVHVPHDGRRRIVDAARRQGRWITLDPVGLHPTVRGAWHPEPPTDRWPRGAFAAALDGVVIAAADPLGAVVQPVGEQLSWRADALPVDGLDDRQRAILAFEARWPRHVGAKEQAIREQLGLTPARYYQLLDRLLDGEAALRHDPLLVGRLRRMRDAATRARAARLPGLR